MLDSNTISLLRQITAITMLATSSYFDIRGRQVDDRIWIIFAIPGILLYFLGPTPSFMTLFFLIIGSIIGIIWFITRVFGQADGLALITLSFALPESHGMPITILVPLITIVMLGVFGMFYNIAYNLSDFLNGKLYSEIDEKNHRKILAFLTIHKRRSHERFVVRSQTDDKFAFHFKPNPNEDFAGDFNGFVSSAFPLLPFMLASLVMVIFW